MQFPGHGVSSRSKSLHLGLDLLCFDEVVRDIDAAGRNQHGAPDRHTSGDGKAEDLKAHETIVAVRRRLQL